ncbi:phosphotransferase [Microbacterium sp. NPDC056234]|uniref:phosphotransferase n=1 Tax=Microbacterium sp. NPDC056234 TaxID=3345757 RepID=UPI0035DDCACE
MHIDQEIAARLIAEQFDDLRGLAVNRLASAGTVNALFRVGDKLVARFPFDPVPAEELQQEAEAMAEFAAANPFRSSKPVGVAAPTERHASAWSLQTWVDGTPATHDAFEDSETLVDDVVALIAALRAVPVGARSFDGRGRGGDLRDHDEWMRECFARSGDLLDVARARGLWERLRELGASDAVSMSHRDLTPPNLLVEGGRLAGVLDSGSFGPADRALDLVAAWHLFDARRRARLRSALEVDDREWLRGAAWSLQQAMGLGWYYAESNPTMSALGLSTMRRLLEDPELTTA